MNIRDVGWHLILWDEPQSPHHESDEDADEYEEGNAGSSSH